MFTNISKQFFSKRYFCTEIKKTVYVSAITDPILNSCVEKYLIHHSTPKTQTLYMWRNDPSVFIGRNQNPFRECNLLNMQQDSIPLIRRLSGGGCVYHDLGNTNFSFISNYENHDRLNNFNIIINALKPFGIDAQIKGRNDLVVGDKKISGSAYILDNNKFIHHGTLLLNLNVNSLLKYLNPNKKKLESKSIQSAQARVTNLINLNPNIDHDNVIKNITNVFFAGENGKINLITQTLVNDVFMLDPFFVSMYKKYTDWNWIYGSTTLFEYNIENYFNWGMINVTIKCDKGIIEDIGIESDSLYPDMIDITQKHLVGKRFGADGINEAYDLFCSDIVSHDTLSVDDKEKCIGYMNEFRLWFIAQI